VAQAALIEPLATAAKSARSSFLKGESFRLLSLLYSAKLNPQASELDRLALKKTEELGETVVASLCNALRDDNMKKSKRVREVLKTTEKVLSFAKACSLSFSNLGEFSELMKESKSKTESQGVQNTFEKLISTIEDLKAGPAQGTKDQEDEDMDEEEAQEENQSSSKKDKKKKSKKKKKKGKK
jgi:hypothetical protein